MQRVRLLTILVFFTLYILIIALAICSSSLVYTLINVGAYEPILMVFTSIFLLIVYGLLAYRLTIELFPFGPGEIKVESKEEFRYHIHLLFHLFLIHPLIRSYILPVPLATAVYQIMGGKFGGNSFSSGLVLDPIFVEIGENTLCGENSIIIPHVLENETLEHHRIKIGSNVTIGAYSMVLPGCIIEDDSMVSAGAVVRKGTHIKRGEIWGGVPAKLIAKRELPT